MTLQRFAGSLGVICALALIAASVRIGHPVVAVLAFVIVVILAQFESLIRIALRKQSFVAPGRNLVQVPRTEFWLQIWFYSVGVAYAILLLVVPHPAWPHVGAAAAAALVTIFVAAPVAVAIVRIAQQPKIT